MENYLFGQKFLVLRNLGIAIERFGVQKGKDVQGQEFWEYGSEIKVLQGDVILELVLYEFVLSTFILMENSGKESFFLRVRL